jgi:hypothetical protein
MKTSRTALTVGLALAAFTSVAQAQLITRNFDVTGVSNAVVARFTMWINLNNDTVVVDINNALPASGGTKVGTITGIGFNTPFAIASQAGDNPGVIEFKAKWTVGSAPGLANNTWSNDDFWTEETPFSLNPTFSQDYGVTASNPNSGIEYGEKATFYFKFGQDLNLGNVGGFFSNNNNTQPNIYDFSVRWQEVDTKWNYFNNGCNGADSDKGGINLIPFSDGDLPPTPEPSTYGLMGAAALLGLVAHRRHKAKKLAKTV